MTYCSAHADQRVFERYGIVTNGADWRQALLDITDTVLGLRIGAVRRSRQPDGKERWTIVMQGKAVQVVYDPAAACIVTVLHP